MTNQSKLNILIKCLFLHHCIKYVFNNNINVLFIFLFKVYVLYRHVYYSAIKLMYVIMPYGSTALWMLYK